MQCGSLNGISKQKDNINGKIYEILIKSAVNKQYASVIS